MVHGRCSHDGNRRPGWRRREEKMILFSHQNRSLQPPRKLQNARSAYPDCGELSATQLISALACSTQSSSDM